MSWFLKYLMNKKFPQALVKHYNTCFISLKKLINGLQNFWKLNIFWNHLHKPWHNDIKNNLKIRRKIRSNWKNILKNIPQK
jgi:hypothetical protein